MKVILRGQKDAYTSKKSYVGRQLNLGYRSLRASTSNN